MIQSTFVLDSYRSTNKATKLHKNFQILNCVYLHFDFLKQTE